MTKPTALPAGQTAVTPHLVCAGAADALDFYARAFDAVEESRMPGPDGKLWHALTRINGAPIMLMDENPEFGATGPGLLGGSPVSIHLYVADVDAVYAQAIAAGASAVMEPADQFWGDRYGVLQDPFGHQWALATPNPDGPKSAADVDAAFQAEVAKQAQSDGS